MKSFALVLVFAQAAIFQSYAQCLRSAPLVSNVLPGPVLAPSPCGCGQTLLPPQALLPQTLLPQALLPQALLPQALLAPQTVLAPSPLVNPLAQVVVQQNSVANNLADTLSLLTVSSLLADTLPLSYPNAVTLPYLNGINYYL